MKIKTIVVTGGSGLVGSAIKQISNKYTSAYYFIFLNSKKCDLTNSIQTKKIFQEINPDYVIHLAACVGGLYKNMSCQTEMYEKNTLININVLQAAKEAGVKNLIACLSTCIFPDQTTYPINETMLHNGPPHPSNECYAYAKRMLEVQCRHYNYTCIIPTNIYGPNDNFNLQDAHVIPALIHKAYLAQKNNEPFIVNGTGAPLRQFIYSTDLATLIMNMVTNDLKKTLIMTPSEEYSIYYVAAIIAEYFNKTVTTSPQFSDGQFRKTADNSKLMETFPNFQFTQLHDGLKQTMDWFVNNYNNCRK